MDVELLSRIQFAITVGFHFIFPPITIGLALMLVIIEWIGWKKNDIHYVKLGRFFAKILAVTFAVGVASGLVMVLQFGTNWARYSVFVGDIFGAPLAAEAVFAFFLESTFLGLYLFGRNRVSKGIHWFSILMVTLGSMISAFWILVANSWQQTPAGFAIQNITTGEIINNPVLGVGYDPTIYRAVLTDFWTAVFNPTTLIRFLHVILASFIAGTFMLAGSCAYIILKVKKNFKESEIPEEDKQTINIAEKGLKKGLVFGLIFSLLQLFPSGHEHARDVYKYQESKFAAIQGLYKSTDGARFLLFGYLSGDSIPEMKAEISIPGLLSWMVSGDFKTRIKGMEEFPIENRPPMWLPFVSYHNMVILGSLFIALTAWGVLQIIRKKLLYGKKFLWILFFSIPLPVLASQFGWVATEVGRQPWTVYNILRTKVSFSSVVPAEQVWFTLILFTVIYLIMVFVYIFILMRELKHAPIILKDKLESN